MPGRASAATDSKIPDALHKAMQGVMDTLFAQIDEEWVHIYCRPLYNPQTIRKSMQSQLGKNSKLTIWSASSGRDISEVFHDLIPKRSLPDYYKVIKNPMAMNPVQVRLPLANGQDMV